MSNSIKFPIRVLVVDDSPFFCKVVSEILQTDPEIELVACAHDPYEAKEILMHNQVDVLTLDLEMPRMDGLTFLRLLMERRPMPVLVLSSLTTSGSEFAMEALMSGAVSVLPKPLNLNERADFGEKLLVQLKLVAMAQVGRASAQKNLSSAVQTQEGGVVSKESSVPLAAQIVTPHTYHPRQIIGLGASTGGTEALKEVLTRMPRTSPGIVVVQHIPAHFSNMFARRLNDLCAVDVLEARHGDRVNPGQVLVAPGGFHMVVQWKQDHYEVELNEGPMVEHQRPAVDVLFGSLSRCAGNHAVAALLTGMGRDGAVGLRLMHEAGAYTVAQDEASCVVFGMSRVAIEMGAADEVTALPNIANSLTKSVQRTARNLQHRSVDPKSMAGISQCILLPPKR